MRNSRRWAVAGAVGAVTVALVLAVSAARRPAAPSAAVTPPRGDRTLSPAEAMAPPVSALPAARPVRIRSGLTKCSAEDLPYPQAIALHGTGPVYRYFNSTRPGWRFDVPDLGITSSAPDQGLVTLYARDFANSDAGVHTATLTWASGSGRQQCTFPFRLQRRSELSMTVTRSGAGRHIAGRLTWASFGPNAHTVGHAGQRIRIRYRDKRKYTYVRTVTTDADGRYALTVAAGQDLWQATYAGTITASAAGT
jgi:hypothetical protein